MKRDLNLTGPKKDILPSKTSLNLYYRDEKKMNASTVALYAVFFAVVGLGLGKWLVLDPLVKLYKANEQLNESQEYLEEQMVQLKDYKDMSELYSRYTYTNTKEDENIIDRMQVLAMLEQTVFSKARVSNMVITGSVVSLDFSGLNLNETSKMVAQIEAFDMVERVDVNTATSQKTIRMVITLIDAGEGGAES